MRRQMRDHEAVERAVAAAPDWQISLTDPDPDARAEVSARGGKGLVGYNLQAAVDADTLIVVAHEVINLSHDRTSLANIEQQARDLTGSETLTVLADRGYFSGAHVLACGEGGIVAICPKPLTSGAKADVRFGKQDLVYQPDTDSYRCSAGETITRRFCSLEHGLTLYVDTLPPAARAAR